MAKSIRSSTRKRNQALRQKKQKPLLAERDHQCSMRLTAYMALQKVRKSEADAKKAGTEPAAIDEETRVAAQHGAELERNDEQKRRLRDQGHFFFVNPSLKSAEDAFPKVSNPNGVIEEYKGTMPDELKNVKMPKLERIALALARDKHYRHKKRHAQAKF